VKGNASQKGNKQPLMTHELPDGVKLMNLTGDDNAKCKLLDQYIKLLYEKKKHLPVSSSKYLHVACGLNCYNTVMKGF
jgi:hypothetical protein